MKKTDTIALYKEEFLAGKPDDVRRKFEEKDFEKQYSSIIAWRRRRRKADEAKVAEIRVNDYSDASDIILELERINNAVPLIEEISHENRGNILRLLDEVRNKINDFDRIKKSQLLNRLESQQAEIIRQRDDLQNRIDSLRNELNAF